jgi:hypothetical protein
MKRRETLGSTSSTAVVLFVIALGALDVGCVECVAGPDCPLGDACVDGRCEPLVGNDVAWLAPAEGDTVGTTYDATIAFTFRAPAAVVRIVRDPRDPGSACAPFIPQERVLPGDPRQAITQEVTFPGLFALGDRFSLIAVLEAGGGSIGVTRALRGPAASGQGDGPAILAPDEGAVDVTRNLLTEVTLGMPEGAASFVRLHVEPIGLPPSPRVLGIVDGARASATLPLVRGPQVIWADVGPAGSGDAALRRCGRGIAGEGQSDGLELGLVFALPERSIAEDEAARAQLDLHVRITDAAGTSTCTSVEPGRCETVRETRLAGARGDEVLRIGELASAVVEVAAVPGAVSPPLSAFVRVSFGERHVGFFGPYALVPERGEAWVAGRVVVNGTDVTLQPETTQPVAIGSPW